MKLNPLEWEQGDFEIEVEPEKEELRKSLGKEGQTKGF
jgi:hypothetical protein